MTQLALLPPVDADGIEGALARAGLRDSSLKRYGGPARSWLTYCADRGECPWDASTATLLRWLDNRLRGKCSPASSLKISLAAVRWVQRYYCGVHAVEAVPYTPRARVQLDAWGRTATLDKRRPTRARPLRLDELQTLIERVRVPQVRPGVTYEHAVRLAARDTALMLVGWWGALRSDDLARLDWDHIEWTVNGVELHIPTSKTEWADLALSSHPGHVLCPREALYLAFRDFSTSRDSSAFGLQTGGIVACRLRTLFRRAGLPRGYTSHSLRSGFATEAAAQGVPDKLVQQHGRWRTAQQHAEYVRAGRLWEDTPTTRIRLAT